MFSDGFFVLTCWDNRTNFVRLFSDLEQPFREYIPPNSVVSDSDSDDDYDPSDDHTLETLSGAPNNAPAYNTRSAGVTLANLPVTASASLETSDEEEESMQNDNPVEADIQDLDSELDHYDVETEYHRLKPTEWSEGMAINPTVGGVHLGKIPLCLTSPSIQSNSSVPPRTDDDISLDSDDESSIQEQQQPPPNLKLAKARRRMLFHSGQVYIPVFKKLTQKVGIKNMREMGSLPAMVTNLMLPDLIHSSTLDEKESVDSLVNALLNVLDKLENEVRITNGNNCVRMEFFLTPLLHRELTAIGSFHEFFPGIFAVSVPRTVTSRLYTLSRKRSTLFLRSPSLTKQTLQISTFFQSRQSE